VKKLWLLLTLSFCAGLLAACGDDDDNKGTATATSASRTATATLEPTDEDDDESTKTPGSGSGNGDYYTDLAGIINSADQETAGIAHQYGGPYDDTADEIDQTSSAFQETGQVFEGMLLSLNDLDPPSAANSAHDDYFQSVQSAAMLFAEALADLGDVSTEAELTAFKNQYNAPLNDASQDIEDKCLVLQGLADAAASDADLGCEVQN
jgi:hypothetical protein